MDTQKELRVTIVIFIVERAWTRRLPFLDVKQLFLKAIEKQLDWKQTKQCYLVINTLSVVLNDPAVLQVGREQ